MLVQTPSREAPARPPLTQPDPSGQDPSFPAVAQVPPTPADEPVLTISNIQGNIIGGFNKDFQTLLFLKIVDEAAFKAWLASLVPFIATAAEVISFNQLFKAIRDRRGDSRTVQATWINIAFSYNALTRLTPDAATAFTDEAFKAGLAARAADMGDPTDPNHEGNPAKWVIGGPQNEADALLIVASDDADELADEVARLEDSIYASRTPAGQPFHSGIQILFKQHGAVLPPPLRGHEHFGFLDGISQPGLRGRLSSNPADVLTPRQNPTDREQGKPGQDLLWPGEFVFGYKKQNSAGQDIADPNGRDADTRDDGTPGPAWTQDGSYLVFRRLRQDVPGFRQFLQNTAQQIGVGADLLGAKLVGRWMSGAPVLRAATADNPALADDDCANNNFEFQKQTGSLPSPGQEGLGSLDCTEQPGSFTPSPGDPSGQICPLSAHIRKSYPRDDVAANPSYASDPNVHPLSEVDTQTHRLLRRGIPFGEPSRLSPGGPELDSGDRGLLFLAYQTSIVNQFEFVVKHWVNSAGFKDPSVGLDPILGQVTNADGTRQRQFTIPIAGSSGTVSTQTLTAPDFVTPTGGGYFFAPSIDALQNTLSASATPASGAQGTAR